MWQSTRFVGSKPLRRRRCTSPTALRTAPPDGLGSLWRCKRTVNAAVRAVQADYDCAWSARDLEHLVDPLAADIVLMNPRRGRYRSRPSPGCPVSVPGSGGTRNGPPQCDPSSLVRRRGRRGGGRRCNDRSLAGTVLVRHPVTDVRARSDRGWRIAHVRAYTPRSGLIVDPPF